MESIARYLRSDYLPPYGTPLTPDDFKTLQPSSSGCQRWGIQALDEQGNVIDWVITTTGIGSPFATATANGDHVMCRDLATKRMTLHAKVQRWYDWILFQDAAGRAVPDDTDSQQVDMATSMRRIECGIVDYSQKEECLANFRRISDFQGWLNDVLAPTSVQVTAFDVTVPTDTEVPYLRSSEWQSDALSPGRRLLDEMEGTVTQLDLQCGPGMSPDEWIGQTAKKGLHFGLLLRMSGSEFIGYAADGYVSYSELVASARLSRSDSHKPGDWWGIHIKRTDFALVFPRRRSNLVIETYNDGSTVHFVPWGTVYRGKENAARHLFERMWGKWLDPDTELSDMELAVGIARAEAMVRGDA